MRLDRFKRALAVAAFAALFAVPALADEELPPELEASIVSNNAEALWRGLRNHVPRLEKTGVEADPENRFKAVENYHSKPSRVALTLTTLPGHGFPDGSAAVTRAIMVRPVADKPSTYDGGLAKTVDMFVFMAAQNWPAVEKDAFMRDCLPKLTTATCARTARGVRVMAGPVGGSDMFFIVVDKP